MKTEFDSDFNNITNRMSQLENSLEAKIDSLVSAYLSRNGIWNGVKQTLSNTQYIVGAIASGSAYSGEYVYWAHGHQVQKNSADSAFRNNRIPTSGQNPKFLANQTNISAQQSFVASKTGLAFINIFWSTYLVNFKTYLTSKVGSYEFSITSSVEFRDMTSRNSVKSSNSFNYTFGWGAFDFQHSLDGDKYATLLLFVTKDSQINQYTTNKNSYVNLAFPSNCQIGWKITVNDVTIY